MSHEEMQPLVDGMSDDELATLIEFVEKMGSVEDVRAAIDALSELRHAA